MSYLVFLCGASGRPEFWQPLISILSHYSSDEIINISYPGFGTVKPHPDINDFASLQTHVQQQIPAQSIIVAQSMGGLFAIAKTLQAPHAVKGLVLIATSGGIDLTPFNVEDWRYEYQEQYPNYPDWFMNTVVNYEAELKHINLPVLLIWGDQDRISPVALGQYLHTQLKSSELHIIKGGKHDLAEQYADQVATIIQPFLTRICQTHQ